MKKFLSFMLVLAMIASMMCINVSAAICDEDHSDTYPNSQTVDHVVGTRKDNPDNISDGAASLDSKTSDNIVIQATINGAPAVRYAVDLEYTQKTITIKNEAVWNVDTLAYDGTISYALTANPTANDYTPFPEDGEVTDSIGDFTVTNYSNAPVLVSATVTNQVEGTSIKTSVKENSTVISDGRTSSTVPAVPTIAYKNATGTAQTCSYSAYMTSDNWMADLWNFSSATGSITIATITFTISSAN